MIAAAFDMLGAPLLLAADAVNAADAAHASGSLPIARDAKGAFGWAGWILWLPLLSMLGCGLLAAMGGKTKAAGWLTVLAAFG